MTSFNHTQTPPTKQRLIDANSREAYERRGAELPEDLIVLFRKCHETFHKNGRLAR